MTVLVSCGRLQSIGMFYLVHLKMKDLEKGSMCDLSQGQRGGTMTHSRERTPRNHLFHVGLLVLKVHRIALGQRERDLGLAALSQTIRSC